MQVSLRTLQRTFSQNGTTVASALSYGRATAALEHLSRFAGRPHSRRRTAEASGFSNVWGNFAISGVAYTDDGDQLDADLPAVVTVVFTPAEGQEVDVRNLNVGTFTKNDDGSVTVVFVGNVHEVSGQVRFTGPGTAGVKITTSNAMIPEFNATIIVE